MYLSVCVFEREIERDILITKSMGREGVGTIDSTPVYPVSLRRAH